MYNFTHHIPTVIHFGKGSVSYLSELKNYGKKALIVYGGGSIKRSGIFDAAVSVLSENGIGYTELGGVEPNPRIETVRKGAEMCRKENADIVLAIGGGSSIDCAKVIAAAAKYDGDAWDLVIDSKKITSALPIFTVLTLSATGSEMDRIAVISDLGKKIKQGTASPYLFPTMSVLDPEYTFSVPRRQTAAGIADMMSHAMENYFSKTKGDCQRFMAEGLLRAMINNGPAALEDPTDYDARADLMWAASHAINGNIGDGYASNWVMHPLEHVLSAYYDITHGEGLAILTPRWMEYELACDKELAPYFAGFARNVWGLSGDDDVSLAKAGIEKLKEFFFVTLGIPSTLREVGITDQSRFEEMARDAAMSCRSRFTPLTKEDALAIYRASF